MEINQIPMVNNLESLGQRHDLNPVTPLLKLCTWCWSFGADFSLILGHNSQGFFPQVEVDAMSSVLSLCINSFFCCPTAPIGSRDG